MYDNTHTHTHNTIVWSEKYRSENRSNFLTYSLSLYVAVLSTLVPPMNYLQAKQIISSQSTNVHISVSRKRILRFSNRYWVLFCLDQPQKL